jgi:hypothetical protein
MVKKKAIQPKVEADGAADAARYLDELDGLCREEMQRVFWRMGDGQSLASAVAAVKDERTKQ